MAARASASKASVSYTHLDVYKRQIQQWRGRQTVKKPLEGVGGAAAPLTFIPVSYTHLDVYKRQGLSRDLHHFCVNHAKLCDLVARFSKCKACLLYTSRCV